VSGSVASSPGSVGIIYRDRSYQRCQHLPVERLLRIGGHHLPHFYPIAVLPPSPTLPNGTKWITLGLARTGPVCPSGNAHLPGGLVQRCMLLSSPIGSLYSGLRVRGVVTPIQGGSALYGHYERHMSIVIFSTRYRLPGKRSSIRKHTVPVQRHTAGIRASSGFIGVQYPFSR